MANKKVLWIINQYAGSSYHGMNFRSYYLAKALIELDYEVHIISGTYSHLLKNFPAEEKLFSKEIIDGINYHWVRVVKYKNSKSLLRFLNMLDFFLKLFIFPIRKLPKPDFIMVSSLPLLPVIQGHMWAKRFNAKFIFEVRDIWPLSLQILGGFSDRHPIVILLSRLEKYAYKHADLVVSMLGNAIEHMKTKGLDARKFAWLQNGIDLKDLAHSTNIEMEIPPNKFIIGYIGTIGISNNIDFILEIAAKLQQFDFIHFVIVGDGGEKIRLLDKVKSMHIENISFFPSVPKKNVLSVVEYFDLCIITWHADPLYHYGVAANKYFDYMSAGKPILEVVNSQYTPVVESGCGFHFESYDANLLAKEIIRISQLDKDELVEIGLLGKRAVEHTYNYQAISKKFDNLITNLNKE